MDEERVVPRPLADPLERIDVRFEPFDPIFDADEDPQLEFWPRRRKSHGAAKAAAAALGMLFGCAGSDPRVAAVDDGIELQHRDLTAVPDDDREDDGTPDEGNDVPGDSGDPSAPDQDAHGGRPAEGRLAALID